MASLFDQLLVKAKTKRRRIGITITHYDEAMLATLKKGQEIADVVIYGNKIPGFECVEMESGDAKGENIGRQIVRDYKDGKIDQFVRGQVDDLGTVDEFKVQFGLPKDERRIDFALMRDAHGREIFLTMGSNPDGQNLDDKIRIVGAVADWAKNTFGLAPKVAVMATCRPGSYGRDPVMSKTYDEAEALVKYLTKKGYEAKNVHIELENAITWANILAPANGTTGNQIFRALVYLGGGAMLTCPTLFSNGMMYEDDSRNEQDWYPHIVAASAWASMEGK
ncbi:MAG: hypothetical protein WC544_02825 [Patescibacteria group bacterium]